MSIAVAVKSLVLIVIQEKERLEMLTRTGGADAHNTIEKLKRVTDSIDILQKEIKSKL